MSPRIEMPVIRQIHRDTGRPLWRRLLWWAEPVVYELVEPYAYTTTIGYRYRGHPYPYHMTMCLPAGFRSDLASTPRLSWVLGMRPDGVFALAAWYHDWYYRHGWYLGPTGCRLCADCGKRFADGMLARMIRETIGVSFPGWLALAALSLFGWPAWWRNRRYRAAAKNGDVQLEGDYGD